MMAHVCNSSTWEAETGGLQVQDQPEAQYHPGLYKKALSCETNSQPNNQTRIARSRLAWTNNDFSTSLDYIERPFSKGQQTIRKKKNPTNQTKSNNKNKPKPK